MMTVKKFCHELINKHIQFLESLWIVIYLCHAVVFIEMEFCE